MLGGFSCQACGDVIVGRKAGFFQATRDCGQIDRAGAGRFKQGSRQQRFVGTIDDDRAGRNVVGVQFGDGVERLLHGHLFQRRRDMHCRLRRPDQPHDRFGLPIHRPHSRKTGDFAVDVEKSRDATGRWRIHDDGVVDVLVTRTSSGRFISLAGEQHVAHTRRDCGGELDATQSAQPAPGRPEVVVHVEVLDQRLFWIDGQGVDDAAVRRSCDAAFGIGQWWAVEQTSQTLTTFTFDEQGASSAGCKRQRQRRRHGGLARAALAGHDMQADAVPVGIDTVSALAGLRVAHQLSVVGG